MTAVIQFPVRESIAVIDGIDVETGRKIYLLEYVSGGARTIVGEYTSLVDLAHAILDWEKDGVPVIEPPKGAA